MSAAAADSKPWPRTGRLLLGLKGTTSGYELGLLRQCGLGGREAVRKLASRAGVDVQEFSPATGTAISRRALPSDGLGGNMMALRRPLLAAAVAAACLGNAQPRRALAQSSGTLNLQAVQDRTLPLPSLATTVGQLTGMELRGSTGERLGRVDEVLQTSGGRIVAVSVQIGGFLGVGGREVILMLDQLRREGDQLVTGLSQAQVEAQPPWDG